MKGSDNMKKMRDSKNNGIFYGIGHGCGLSAA